MGSAITANTLPIVYSLIKATATLPGKRATSGKPVSPGMGRRSSLFPVHGALDSSFPVGIKHFALVRTHSRLKRAINRPLPGHFLRTAPKSSCQTCQVSSTQGGRLGNLWPLHRHAENISLELHEQVIDNCATIDTQSLHMYVTISSHHLKHITSLVAHRLECSASNMGGG